LITAEDKPKEFLKKQNNFEEFLDKLAKVAATHC
jgi:hypothetical protein